MSASPDLAEDAANVLPATPPAFEFAGEVVATALAPMRVSEPFERLRDMAEALARTAFNVLGVVGSDHQDREESRDDQQIKRDGFENAVVVVLPDPSQQKHRERRQRGDRLRLGEGVNALRAHLAPRCEIQEKQHVGHVKEHHGQPRQRIPEESQSAIFVEQRDRRDETSHPHRVEKEKEKEDNHSDSAPRMRCPFMISELSSASP